MPPPAWAEAAFEDGIEVAAGGAVIQHGWRLGRRELEVDDDGVALSRADPAAVVGDRETLRVVLLDAARAADRRPAPTRRGQHRTQGDAGPFARGQMGFWSRAPSPCIVMLAGSWVSLCGASRTPKTALRGQPGLGVRTAVLAGARLHPLRFASIVVVSYPSEDVREAAMGLEHVFAVMLIGIAIGVWRAAREVRAAEERLRVDPMRLDRLVRRGLELRAEMEEMARMRPGYQLEFDFGDDRVARRATQMPTRGGVS